MENLLDKKIEIPSIDDFIRIERKAVDAVVGLFKNTARTFKPLARLSPEDDCMYPNAFSTEIEENRRQKESELNKKILNGPILSPDTFRFSPTARQQAEMLRIRTEYAQRHEYQPNEVSYADMQYDPARYRDLQPPTPPAGGTGESPSPAEVIGPRFEIPLAKENDFVNIDKEYLLSGLVFIDNGPASSAALMFNPSQMYQNVKKEPPLKPPDPTLVERANAILFGTPEITPTDD